MRKFLSIMLAVLIVASVAVVSFSAESSGGVATVTLKNVKGETVTKTYAVGDTITAYTYLNASAVNQGRIGSLNAKQTYTNAVLELADAYDPDEGEISDLNAMFPVTGNVTVASGHWTETKEDPSVGAVYYNASKAALSGFQFNTDTSGMIITHYTVKAAGTAEIVNTVTTLAVSNDTLERIIDKGEIVNENFTSPIALSEPQLPIPEGFTVSGTATSYMTTTGEGNDVVTVSLTGTDNNFTGSVNVTAEYATAKVGAKAETAYSIENVPAGSYVLSVAKKNHVTREYEVTVSADTTQDVVICPKGDANNDGSVKANDAMAAYRHAQSKTTITDEYKLACANVAGGDSVVKANDAMQIYRHASNKKSLFE